MALNQERIISGPEHKNQEGEFDLEKELHLLFDDFEWDILYMVDKENNHIPVPKNSTAITAIIEQKGIKILTEWAEKKGITLIESPDTRTYPDSTLESGPLGNDIIALDFKTSRKKSNTSCSKFTIGSYAGYFMNPTEKRPGCRIPYCQYTQHWIVGFIYDWDDTKNTEEMVNITNVIISEKWQIASKSTGTGTTKHMASVSRIDDLEYKRGVFQTRKEFEEFWRNYGNTH